MPGGRSSLPNEVLLELAQEQGGYTVEFVPAKELEVKINREPAEEITNKNHDRARPT
jgi:hypothetical protein